MATLYELQGAYEQLQQMIEEGAEGLEDTLASVEGALDEKLVGYAMVIKNLEADANAYEAEEKRFKERKIVAQNGIKRMKKAIHETMDKQSITKLNTEKFNFNIQNTKASISVVDGKSIPEKFMKVKKEYDNTAIYNAIKRGEEVPGAELKPGQTLVIR